MSNDPHDLERFVQAQAVARAYDPVFQQILDKYFDGKTDDKTLQLIDAA